MTDRPGREELLATWRAEETGQPEGWDFSDLDARIQVEDVPWNFDRLTRDALSTAGSALDLGTGGGERLLEFLDDLPEDVVATEGWAPNVPVARAALEPHGIEVVAWPAPGSAEVDRARLPFPDRRFDLVLVRHEAYDPVEIERVLRRGGLLLTQQVDGTEFHEVRDLLGHPPPHPGVTYRAFRDEANAAGLEVVDGAEHHGFYGFCDVAALVAYLQRVPWEVPADFSVDRYAEELLSLHEGGPGQGMAVLVSRKRFWLAARRP